MAAGASNPVAGQRAGGGIAPKR